MGTNSPYLDERALVCASRYSWHRSSQVTALAIVSLFWPTFQAVADEILGVAAYAPSTESQYDNSTSTLSDVDATNLSVTFIAPPSGVVWVNLQATAQRNNGGATWGIREGSTNIARIVFDFNSGSIFTHKLSFRIDGLTPGSSHTYKWSHATDTLYAGTVNGRSPCLMSVWSEGVNMYAMETEAVLCILTGFLFIWLVLSRLF